MTATRPRAASLLLTAAAAGAAGAAFHRAFPPTELVVPVGVAAVAPVALVAASTWLRWTRRTEPTTGEATASPSRPSRPDSPSGQSRPNAPSSPGNLSSPRTPGSPVAAPLAATVLGSLGLLAGLLAALFVTSGTAPGQVPAAVLDAAVDGWAELLDVTLPTPSEPRLLAVPVMLTWLASAAGAEIVSRTRTVLTPAVPSVLAFGAGLALTVPGSGSNVGVAAVLAAAVGLLALARRVETTASDAHETAAGRATARALPVLAAATAVGVLVGPLLPFVGSDPVDPRDNRPLPQRETEVANPLGYLSAWQRSPGEVLFTVRLTTGGSPAAGSPAGTPAAGTPTDGTPNLRLAVLDQYDGRTWSSSARFTPAGLHVPAEASGSTGAIASDLATADPVTQDVEIADLDLPLLPAVDRPLELSGSDLAVDLADGTLVSTAQVHPGLRYHVVSVPRVVADPTDLAVAHNPSGPDAAAHRTVPAGTPPVVRDAARTATAAAVTPFQQAYLLTAYLRDNFTHDPQAVSGHTLGHLRFFLETGRRGTSEQFATTFAVAARTLGLATRVVVGFAPPGASGAVRAGDAFAWPEVAFEGLGWVPFYPTPGPTSSDPSNVPGESSAAAATMLEAASAPQPTPETVQLKPVRQPPAGIEAARPSWLPAAAAAAAGVLVVAAVAYLGTAVVRPAARRRRRRRAADDRDRLVGAWHDTLDTLDGYGIVVGAATTPNETADVTAAGLGAGVRVNAHNLNANNANNRASAGVAGHAAATAAAGDPATAGITGVTAVSGVTGHAKAAVNGVAGDPMRQLAALTSVALFAPEQVGRAAADEAWEQQTRLRRALRRDVPRRRRLRGRLAPRHVLGRRPRPGRAPHPRT